MRSRARGACVRSARAWRVFPAKHDRRPRGRGGRDQREADVARAGKGDAPRPPPEGRGRAGGGGGGQAAPHAARRARSAGRAADTARPKTLKASKLSKVGEKFPPLYLTGDFFRADYQRITQT